MVLSAKAAVSVPVAVVLPEELLEAEAELLEVDVEADGREVVVPLLLEVAGTEVKTEVEMMVPLEEGVSAAADVVVALLAMADTVVVATPCSRPAAAPVAFSIPAPFSCLCRIVIPPTSIPARTANTAYHTAICLIVIGITTKGPIDAQESTRVT